MRGCGVWFAGLGLLFLAAAVTFVVGVVPAMDRYGENMVSVAQVNAAGAAEVAGINAAAAVSVATVNADRDKTVASFEAATAGVKELGGITRLAIMAAALVLGGVLILIGLAGHQLLRYGATVSVQSQRGGGNWPTM